jgi:hypothetical protein
VHEALIVAAENAKVMPLISSSPYVKGYIVDKESILSVEPKLIKK